VIVMANHADRNRKKKPRRNGAERAERRAGTREKRTDALDNLALAFGGGAVGVLASRIMIDAGVTPRTAAMVLLGTGALGASTLRGHGQFVALGMAAEASGRLVLAHMLARERRRKDAARRNAAEAKPPAPPRLSTLADLQPAARKEEHAPVPGALATFDDLAAPAAASDPTATEADGPTLAPRNADARGYQLKLREDVQNLVKNFGYREELYDDPVNPPRALPYLPMPFAAQMLTRFEKDAKHWLGRGIPENAKQPGFIKNRLAEAREILGVVKDGVVETPNPESYEDAPPAIAAKVPGVLKGMVRPDVLSKVLRPAATARFLDKLHALAMHFDALSGQPSKLDLFSDAADEQAEHVAEVIGGAAEGVLEGAAQLPRKIGKLAGAGASLFKWGALAALALGVLLVLKR
jgi:hypothetical protein